MLSLVLVSCGDSGGESSVDPNPGQVDENPLQVQQPVVSDDELPEVSDPESDPEPDPELGGILPAEVVHPYRPDSPYAEVLKRCVLVHTVEASCTLDTLPFIGQVATIPDIDDILDRLLVTHDWMGDRLAEVLRAAPADLQILFGSTTSILIGSEVRPSSYTGLNGGIQLDPNYLWQSVAEKRTVSVEEDYRSDYGRDLGFWFYQRHLINGERAYPYFDLEDDSTRELEDLLIPVVRLLYHELAHANDYLPPTAVTSLDSSLQVFEALDLLRDQWLSPQLDALYPLNNESMYSLAQVRFRGADATDAEKEMTAADVGQQFAEDGSANFYSYNTIREDLAVLFEATMMRLTFGLQTNIAFIDKIDQSENPGCEEYLVGWGVRNRLANPLVAQRAHWVVTQIYGGNEDFDQYMTNGLGAEETMTEGVDWCTNNKPETVQAARSRAGDEPDKKAERLRLRMERSELR